MSEHTPGEWQSRSLGFPFDPTCEEFEIRTSCDGYIGRIDSSRDENAANARLIAAAPDLLAACEAALRLIPGGDDECVDMVPELNQIRAAIRKARGES